jgi:hypothetical protein
LSFVPVCFIGRFSSRPADGLRAGQLLVAPSADKRTKPNTNIAKFAAYSAPQEPQNVVIQMLASIARYDKYAKKAVSRSVRMTRLVRG